MHGSVRRRWSRSHRYRTHPISPADTAPPWNNLHIPTADGQIHCKYSDYPAPPGHNRPYQLYIHRHTESYYTPYHPPQFPTNTVPRLLLSRPSSSPLTLRHRYMSVSAPCRILILRRWSLIWFRRTRRYPDDPSGYPGKSYSPALRPRHGYRSPLYFPVFLPISPYRPVFLPHSIAGSRISAPPHPQISPPPGRVSPSAS